MNVQFFTQYPKAKPILITFAVIIAFLILLPVALQWGGIYALKKQGATQASIEDIDLNLFTGKLTIKNISAHFSKNRPPLNLKRVYVDVYVPDLLNKLIHIQAIEIDQLSTQVIRTKDSLEINGYVIDLNTKQQEPSKPESESSPWGVVLNKSAFNDLSIQYKEADLEQNLSIQSLSIQNIKTLDAQSVSTLKATISEAATHINADLSMQLFQAERTIKGSLAIKDLTPNAYAKFYKAHLDQLNASLNLDTTFDLTLGDSIKGEFKHELSVNQLLLEHKQVQQQLKQLSWNGIAHINGDKVSVKGDLSLDGSKLKDLKTQQLLQSFNHLQLTQVDYQAQHITFEALLIKQLSALTTLEPKENKNTLLSFEALQLKKFEFLPQQAQLNLAKVSLTALQADATLNAAKKVTAIETLQKTIDRISPAADTINKDTSEQETVDSESKPLQINVTQFEINKPSKIHFNDQSVTPHYDTQLAIEQLVVKNITQQSPANFDIQLKQGEYGEINVKGTGLLFDPKKQLEVEVAIKQLDLPPITPYSSPAIGYAINSGVIDSTIKANINKSQLDSDVKMTIDTIEIIEGDKESAEELASASGMSIDLALSTLKDSDNVIELDVPIKGNLDSPDFDLSLVINKALGGAMKAASLFYLKNSLQPFGSLLTLYSLAKRAANSMALAPVEFEPNKTALRDTQKQLLDKISNVLKERPGIKIKTCAVSNIDDQQAIVKALTPKPKKGTKKDAKKTGKKPVKFTVPEKQLNQALISLADKRSSVVKAYITKEKGIAPKRILNCLSAKNVEDKEIKPAVELLI